MSKTKSDSLSHYELLFIVPNKYTEDEAKQVIAKTGTIIKENGGNITFEEYWGKKRLAYAIKQNHYGYYSLFEFDLEGKNLAKLDKIFRLSGEILRHQIVTKVFKSPEELKIEKERKERVEKKKAETEKEKKTDKTAVTTSPVKQNLPSNSSASNAKKVDLKDLDEKLEGILNAKDLV
ncbi:MAG: 30S ribosomal protein S6 [Candidatus Falkowbacteria bacterium]|nr:30S ribosomal protein S6 [Candidatus Falkowbacteria bacterium]